ncbi:hypothetical protein DES53_10448 [Roseimicrobium gellanilyticum]|uniref:Uncharacterized protein n=1 Tax=Roseimicrobium gellanilyticum TaxID=748857 RepID=A0A366HM60_9BACT|nr:hypothetical protein [Roseimicrobium gellanilyticum]RBP44229.1 hypothetical protein DES53_10448 [Roseimicrobium gellanilyticum]
MLRRFVKVLLTLLLLAFIAAVGVLVIALNVEDPLTFQIASQEPTAAGDLTGPNARIIPSGSGATTLKCEVKNTSIFPIEFLPTTSILLPAKDANTAFLPASEVESVVIRLTPGQTYQGKLYGPQPLNAEDIHTFSYDWNVRGQNEVRTMLRWLDENAGFVPDSWLASLFWHTEPRKGRVKNVDVTMPGAAATASESGDANKDANKASVP